MVNTRVLVWDKVALNNLKNIFDYLKAENNLVFAKEVKDMDALLPLLKKLSESHRDNNQAIDPHLIMAEER